MPAVKQVFKDLRGKVYLSLKAGIFIGAGLLAMQMIGCTKSPDATPVVIDSIPPVPNTPTGIIKDFSIDDTLIGYRRSSLIRWNVIGTNIKTKVYLIVSPAAVKPDSIQVPLYGTIHTGALLESKTYSLYVNSGRQVTRTLKVADSIATLLWNDGKRWRPVDVLSYELVIIQGVQQKAWVSYYTLKADQYQNERVNFYLDGNSKETQLSGNYPQPKPSGKFYSIPGLPLPSFSWKGRLYTIDTVDSKNLVVRFDSLQNGSINTTNRIKYASEF